MMKRILVLLALLPLFVTNGYSQQLKNSRPRVALDFQMRFRLANLPLKVMDFNGDKLHARTGSAMTVIFQKEDYPGTYGSFFSPEIGLLFMPSQYPMALRFSCGWENTAFAMEYNHVIRERWCFLSSIKPAMEVKVIIGDRMDSDMFPIAIAGVAYNIPINTTEGAYYHKRVENQSFANKGIEGEIGIGLMQIPEMRSGKGKKKGNQGFLSNAQGEFSLVYKYRFYNLFNQQFQNEAGEKPFEGLTTRYGDIWLNFVVRGFLN